MQNNPYSTPQADLVNTNHVIETNTSGIWSMNGRIGRAQYAAYGFITYFVFSLVGGVLSLILSLISPIAALAVNFITQIPILFYLFVLAKRRLNDIGHSGWLSLIYVTPLVGMFGLGMMSGVRDDPTVGLSSNWVVVMGLSLLVSIFLWLYLIIRRGEAMPNQYGLPPAKGKTWMYVVALIIPIVALIGILAAIAIPAYQDYTERAKSAQVELPAKP